MEFKSIILKDSAIDMSAGIFEGYASTWDEDQVGDIILPGAFKKTLAEGLPNKRIKGLWQHADPFSMPQFMEEDSKGLYVKAKVSRAREAMDRLEYMRDGIVDRMSIGFSLVKDKWGYNDEGNRIISEIKLFEYSPVTFPANEEAGIIAVKSLKEQLIIAKSKGMALEDSAHLLVLFDELKALLTSNEPNAITHDETQPLIDECKSSLNQLGDFARTLNFK